MNNLISKLFNKYFWSDLWYTQVSSRLNPRQKWLTKKIPRTWMDAGDLLELCAFESLIFWWTKDGGESITKLQYEDEDDPETKEAAKQVYDRLKAAYEWVAHGRAAAVMETERTVDSIINKDNPLENLKKFNQQQEEIESLDTFYLKEIVELRKYMWS